MPNVTIDEKNRNLVIDKFIRSLSPTLFINFSKQMGSQFVSEDAHGFPLTASGTIKTNYGRQFNGTTDAINTNKDWDGTGAFSFMGWITPTGWGGSNAGRILDNGKLYWRVDANGSTYLTSDGGITTSQSATSVIALNTRQWIGVTRAANGTTNFYTNVNGIPTLSGAANQNSGTPAAGTSVLFIGNRSTLDRGFNGTIHEFVIVQDILPLYLMGRHYLLTKWKYV